MTKDELVELYDRCERIGFRDPQSKRLVDGGTVTHLWPDQRDAVVLYSRLSAGDADEAIRREVGRARELSYHLEWKHFSHDSPADLKTRLAAAGLQQDEEEAVMVLPLDPYPERLALATVHDVRQATTAAEFADADAVYRAVWSDRSGGPTGWIWPRYQANPEIVRLYVAYVDGVPASLGRLELPPGSPFAGLWGGSTDPRFRGKGLYTALVAARAAAARAAGRRYLTVDANPGTSMPILAAHGFVEICRATAFTA